MGDHTTARILMRAPPERCFAAVADVEHYPEWAVDIKSVEVLERDGEGRPAVVAFRAAAFGRSTHYRLAYDYSRAPTELSWHQLQGDITSQLEGAYRFEPTEDGDTEVTYQLAAALSVPIPGFVKRRAEGRIVQTALGELKARIERNPPDPA